MACWAARLQFATTLVHAGSPERWAAGREFGGGVTNALKEIGAVSSPRRSLPESTEFPKAWQDAAHERVAACLGSRWTCRSRGNRSLVATRMATQEGVACQGAAARRARGGNRPA